MTPRKKFSGKKRIVFPAWTHAAIRTIVTRKNKTYFMLQYLFLFLILISLQIKSIETVQYWSICMFNKFMRLSSPTCSFQICTATKVAVKRVVSILRSETYGEDSTKPTTGKLSKVMTQQKETSLLFDRPHLGKRLHSINT